MNYDFTTILDRKGKDALAVDALGTMPGMSPNPPKDGFDVIPMWVADMNFPVVPTIQEAVISRMQHPAYGYFSTSQEYYDSIIRWQTTRNKVEGLTEECIGYENGVLGGLISALHVMAQPGDQILVHSPTYIGFTNSLTNAGYRIVLSPLKQDEDGIWRMDLADMEKKLSTGSIAAAIFCSPHNPCGRVWERWELEKAMALYEKYDCPIVSDEIWSDLTLGDYQHIPTQSVSEYARENTVALYAPSKTFNLAGLIGSYHIIYNAKLRKAVENAGSKSHYNSMNVLSMHALIGAYRQEGYDWVDQLKEVLTENVSYACDYINQHFEGISVSQPQGTYMLFLDCETWCREHGKTMDELLAMGWDVGVAWQDGRPFHGTWSIRMNLALPLSRVQEAMRRLTEYVF